jgi:hypothetical protein
MDFNLILLKYYQGKWKDEHYVFRVHIGPWNDNNADNVIPLLQQISEYRHPPIVEMR